METDKNSKQTATERIIDLHKFVFGENIRIIDTTESHTAEVVDMPQSDTDMASAS